MATMKRRVIYLADEDWERLKTRAAELGMTISAYLRTTARIANTESGVSYEVRPRLVADEDVIDHELGTTDQQSEATSRLAQGKPGTTLVERYDLRPIRPVPKR